MTEKYIPYKYNGEIYDIPESKSAEFEKHYPSATIEMHMDGEIYDIPLAHKQEAIDKYGPRLTYAFEKDSENTSSSDNVTEEEDSVESLKPTGPTFSFSGFSPMGPQTSSEDTKEAKVTAEKEDEGPSVGESFVKGAGAGFTRAGKGLLGALNLLTSGYTYNDPETGEAKRTDDYDTLMRDKTNPFRNAYVLAGETADRLSKEADPTGGEKGFVDLISEGKLGTALQKGVATMAESLPMTLSAYNPYTMALNFVSMAADNYGEETLNNPDIDPWKRGVYAIGTAAFEQAVEKFADPVFKYIGGGKGAGKITEEMAKEIMEKGTKDAVKNIAKRIFQALGRGTVKTLKDAGGEGLEEIVTSLGTDALGSALDAIDGNDDYGFSAQWKQYKAEHPNADRMAFAEKKAKEYVDAFLGGALSGGYMSGPLNVASETSMFISDSKNMNQMQEAREKGATLGLANMYDLDDISNEQVENAAKSMVNENGETMLSREFISTLSSDEAYALSRSERLSPQQKVAFQQLANAKAMQEGLRSKLDSDLENNVNAQKVLIEHVADNGIVVAGFVDGNPVYVKGGVENNGAITLPNGENGPVIVINALTGEQTTINSNEIQKGVSQSAEEYSTWVEGMLRDNDARNREVARNTMSPRAKLKAVTPYVGKKMYIDLGGGIIEVGIQNVSPESGTVLIKGKKGDLGGQSMVTLNASTFYDSIHRDDDGNPMLAEGEVEVIDEMPAEEEAPVADEVPVADVTGDEDFREQAVTILIDGVPTNVYVTSQDNTSDSIVYEYEDANGNKKSGSSTIGAFKGAMQKAEEYKPEEPTAIEGVETDIETPPVTEEPAPVESAPQEVPVTPETIDWDMLFDNDPETFFTELQNQFGEDTADVINDFIATAEEDLASLEKKKGKTMNDRIKDLQRKSSLKLRIGTLYDMLNRLKSKSEPIAEPIATEEDAPVESPTTPPANESAPTVEGTTITGGNASEPISDPTEPEAKVETPTPVQQAPVAPTKVADPIRESQKKEKHLATQLKRYDLSPEQKQDMAFNVGKSVADMFATREEYEAYAENATDLGDYNADFERGVDESFANRQQNVSDSPVNSIPLENEPKVDNNGEANGTSGKGPSVPDNSGRTTDEGGEGGNQAAPKVSKGKTNKGKAGKKVADKYPARKGNATQKLLVDTFGFNKVEIPNSRKETLNTIYDFMMAMSKMLGISPKSIGQGGWLDVASLRSNSTASAEHSLLSKTIDQSVVKATLKYKYSKLSGLAHEWWHALDHALSYFETGKGKVVASEIAGGRFTGRKETWEAVQQVIKAIKDSGHENRIYGLKLPRRYTSYLTEPSEMAARAFDEYIKAKFEAAGITIDNSVDTNFVAQPTAEEMAIITPAFDNLFEVLQEKEGKTPGTSVLYHIGEMMDEDSDAKKLATDAVLTALDNYIEVEEVSDQQAENARKASGINDEFMVAPDNPVFVSNAALAVANIKQEKATPEQWLKMIEKAGGLKAGEDKWMGLSDWLKASDKKTLTKAEVLDFINENMIVIEEQHYSNKGVREEADRILNENYPGWEDAFSFDWDPFMEEPHSDIYDEVKAARLYNETHEDQVETDEDGDIVNDADYNKVEEFGAELAGIWYGRGQENTVREIHGTREEYTTNGLTNLHEIALTVPTIEPWNESDDIHFGDAGEGRAVAWIRFGEAEVNVQDETQQRLNEIYDRLDELEMKVSSTGITEEEYNERARLRIERDELQEIKPKTQRVLVIDEIQSKRHQEGREKGYKPDWRGRRKLRENLEKADREVERVEAEIIAKYGSLDNVTSREDLNALKTAMEVRREARLEFSNPHYGAIPDAPFDKNWHELAMKRMLRYAAENGYDVVAWTTGDQQAERYGIGKVVSSVAYRRTEDGKRVRVNMRGGESLLFDIDVLGKVTEVHRDGGVVTKGMALSEIVGSDLAKQIQNYEGEVDERGDYNIKSEDFRIGGEGMKGFYDKILPAFMNKYGKKWGVKVEDIELPNLEEAGRVMHSVPVTDSMKDSVMDGQVMFMKRPNGKVYGWTDGKKIYLTKAGINPNTPVHEYTHLWAKAMMQKNPKGWNSIKSLLKGTPIWDEVINDPNYSDIKNNEDAVASEVLSRISGSENAAKLEKMAQQMIDEAKGTARKLEARGLIQNIKDALNKFWNWVGTELFGIENFESVEQVTDRVLWDLMNKTDLGELSEGQVEAQIVTDPKVSISNENSVSLPNVSQAIESGVWNDAALNELNKIAEDVEDGKAILKRYTSSELTGLLEGGRLLVGASIISRGSERNVSASRGRAKSLEEKAAEIIPAITAWAKSIGAWRDYSERSEEEIAHSYWTSGGEAQVFYLGNGKVEKIIGLDYFVDPQLAIDRIAIHNSLFEETQLRVTGFGTNKDGQFAIIVEQPTIIGKHTDNSEIDSYIESIGFKKVDDTTRTFANEDLYLSDLHEENVLNQNHERYYVIDGDFRLNTPEAGIGGTRQIDDSIVRDDSENLLFRSSESPITPEMDADYLAAVERGDMETAQRMVLEAAKLAMPNTAMIDRNDYPKIFYHNTDAEFTAFGAEYNGTATDAGWLGDGFYFYGDPTEGDLYGRNKMQVFLNIEEPYYATSEENKFLAEANSRKESIAFSERLKEEWYDGVYYNGDLRQEAVAFYPSQIKSADPVTYDDNGNVIPLSERFNPEKNDIRYRKSDIQNAAADYLAGPQRTELIQRAVNEEASKLGVKVTYKTRSEMPKGHENDKGYYNTKTGEIVICTENASSVADAIQTILHEAVAHKGLRQLMGDKFNDFISRVYDSLDAETKAKVDTLATEKYDGNTAVATEEYIASLAETEDFANNSLWDKIKSIFEDIINAILGRNDIKIGDNELRYILRASYANMVNPRNMDTIEGWAKDKVMREEYKINEATPEIMSRTGISPTEIAKATAAEVYANHVSATWNEFQRQFQDAMQPVRVAIDAIQQETGNVPIEDYENYILIQNQSSSRSRVEIDNFQRKFYSPIIKQVNALIDKIMESRGWKLNDEKKRSEVYKEVRQYLIAKHGLERNKYYQTHKMRHLKPWEKQREIAVAQSELDAAVEAINSDASLTDAERELQIRQAQDVYNAAVAEINEREVPDVRDYAGLTALFGMDAKEFKKAEEEAAILVENFENDNAEMTEELWKRINKATDKTLRHSYECGLISRQQYNDIKGMFNFYIPLRGFDETTAEDVYSYARFEGNRFNPAVHKTGGRTSLADDPIAIIMNMAESEIAQGNKNRAKQALYNFILNRPIVDSEGNQKQNSLMQIENVWYLKNVDENGNEVYSIASPDRERGETYEEFEARMKEKAENGEAMQSKKGKVDVGLRFQKPSNANAHYIYLKVNGVEKAIYVNGDPKAAEAVNGTYKPKPIYQKGSFRTKYEKVNKAIEFAEDNLTMSNVNRLISSTFTNYSLEFTVRNYFRDMVYSHINIDIKEHDPAYRKKFRKNWRHNNLKSMVTMLKAYRAGEFEGRELNADEAAFVEFMENGGQTGYTLINSVETRKRDLERAIKKMQNGDNGGVKDSTVFRYTLGAVELLNEASELVTRFAAFKTSRDMGRSVVRSISDAKEITVNFNTKGAQDGKGFFGFLARCLGASKFFFNASVQGVQNIAAMAKANKLKFCSVVGGMAAWGFLMPVIVSAISEMLGGDDDEYWNIPEYDRQNNFCVPVGNGMYAKIPLPIGFREMYALGDMVAAMAFDKKFSRNALEVGTDMANKIASIVLPINPLESTANGLSVWHTMAYTALPSSAQFIIQNMSNVDWKGSPLQKEYTYNENDPAWMKAFENNPAWMKGLSKWCNEHIDLNDDYKGMDWSPEKLDNTLSNLFGGIYTLIKKTGNSFSMIWNEENRNLSNVPMAGVFLGSGIENDDRFVIDAYFEQKDYYDQRVGTIKTRAKQFGYELDDIFEKKKGKHHPKIQEIYANDNFEFMQEWYKGNKELEKLNKDIQKLELKIAEKENPSESLVMKLNKKKDKFLVERREFVNKMLEID